MSETLTEVRNEPADDVTALSLETLTKVAHEPADELPTSALETMTRVRHEPADEDLAYVDDALPIGDDLATGLVSF